MCTQDHILYSCLHALKGEKHPCAHKQSSPHSPCWSNTRRELSLKQRCPDCRKGFLATKNTSHWPYVEHQFLGKPLPAKLLWRREKEEESWSDDGDDGDEGTKVVDFTLFDFGEWSGGRDKEGFAEEKKGKWEQEKERIAFRDGAFDTNDTSTRAQNGYSQEQPTGLGLGLELGIGLGLGFLGDDNPKQIPVCDLGRLEQIPILPPPPSPHPRLASPIVKRRSPRQQLELVRGKVAKREEALNYEKALSYEKTLNLERMTPKRPRFYDSVGEESDEDQASTPKAGRVIWAEMTPRVRVPSRLSYSSSCCDGESNSLMERRQPILEDLFGSLIDDVPPSPKTPRSRTPRHLGSYDRHREGDSKYLGERRQPIPKDSFGSHTEDVSPSRKFLRKRDSRHLGSKSRVRNGESDYMTERRQPIPKDLFGPLVQDAPLEPPKHTEWESDPFRHLSKRSREQREQKARVQELFDLKFGGNTEDDLADFDESFGTGSMDMAIR